MKYLDPRVGEEPKVRTDAHQMVAKAMRSWAARRAAAGRPLTTDGPRRSRGVNYRRSSK